MTIDMTSKILLIGDYPNKNGYTYPRNVLLSMCDDSSREYHGSFINVDFSDDHQKVAIIAKNLRVESNILLCDFTIQDTLYGLLLQKYIKEQPFMLSPHGSWYIDDNDGTSKYNLKHINVELT